jgi:hypothetical protein
MYPPCFRTEGRLTSIEALARPVAFANDRQGERKIDDVERYRSHRVVDNVLAAAR